MQNRDYIEISHSKKLKKVRIKTKISVITPRRRPRHSRRIRGLENFQLKFTDIKSTYYLLFWCYFWNYFSNKSFGNINDFNFILIYRKKQSYYYLLEEQYNKLCKIQKS